MESAKLNVLDYMLAQVNFLFLVNILRMLYTKVGSLRGEVAAANFK